jgi:hypothetical protein
MYKPMNFKNAISSVLGLLLSIHTFAYPTPKTDSNRSPVIPSGRYSVEFRSKGERKWNEAFVYQSINHNRKDQDVSWVSLPLEKPIEIRISAKNNHVGLVQIRPLAYQTNYSIRNQYIYIQIPNPLQVSVEINGDKDHPLLLFIDPPEEKPDRKSNENIVRFKKGIHNIGERYPLASNTTYYLETGAYLKGSMYGKSTVKNVTIQGRGIIDSGNQKWRHPAEGLLSNIAFEDGRNIRIEGITCINAGNFQLKIQSKDDNDSISINNVKLIGWNKNTDGIHISDMDWKDNPKVGNGANLRLKVSNCFIRANDDAVLLCDGVAYSEMTNCVLWDDGYGSTFCLSWGGHNKVDSCLVSHCSVIHKEGSNPVFRAMHAGEATIQHVRFEDITIEGNAQTLVGLKITNHRYDPDAELGCINDLTFRNITLEGESNTNYLEGFSEDHLIENVTFENLRINGKVIKSAEEMNLKTNQYVRNLNFK